MLAVNHRPARARSRTTRAAVLVRSELATPYDMFCAGHAFLPNGNLLVAGGTSRYPDIVTDSNYFGS